MSELLTPSDRCPDGCHLAPLIGPQHPFRFPVSLWRVGFPNRLPPTADRFWAGWLRHPAQIQLTGVLIRLALKVVGS